MCILILIKMNQINENPFAKAAENLELYESINKIQDEDKLNVDLEEQKILDEQFNSWIDRTKVPLDIEESMLR